MPNYRLSVDLSDLQRELSKYDLRDYRLPFSLYILESISLIKEPNFNAQI